MRATAMPLVDVAASLHGRTAEQERLLGLLDDARVGRSGAVAVVGEPGAGKSLLADTLVSLMAPCAAGVPLDGFHLADRELDRLGLADRKGAPETFDAWGYAALLARLRDRSAHAV